MIEDIRIFVKIVQLGGFGAAAKALGIPTSTISRTIMRLEEETGTKLLLRTTRSLNPTPAGRVFYENCMDAVQTLEDARNLLNGNDALPQGLVRITAPEDIGEHIISPAIGALTRAHPGLSFELEYSDKIIDLVDEGFDLAIRMGKLKPSRMTVKKVGFVSLIMVASSTYLETNGTPLTPQDLVQHSCITINTASFRKNWELRFGSSSCSIAIQPRVVSNQMTGMISIAMQGAGIAFVPGFLCHAHLKSGRLVRVLPEWTGEEFPVSILNTQGKSKALRLKIVTDRLAKEISKRLS